MHVACFFLLQINATYDKLIKFKPEHLRDSAFSEQMWCQKSSDNIGAIFLEFLVLFQNIYPSTDASYQSCYLSEIEHRIFSISTNLRSRLRIGRSNGNSKSN